MSLFPRDLLLVLGLAAAALLAPTFHAERRMTGDSSVRPTLAEHLPVGERLAYAALSDIQLIRPKYESPPRPEPEGAGEEGGEAPAPSAERGKRVPPRLDPYRVLTPEADYAHPYLNCINRSEADPTAWGAVDPVGLTLALAAVENYNRRAARRRLERWSAQLLGAVGAPANPSLGVTQIRLSHARRLTAARLPVALDRHDVADFLENDCNAIRVAFWRLEELAQGLRRRGAAPTVERLATAYHGGRTFHGSEFPYPLVVASAYQLMWRAGLFEDAGVEQPQLSISEAACFEFSPWAGRVTHVARAGVREGQVSPLSEAEFDAAAARGQLVYLARGEDAWHGRVRAKLLRRMSALAGATAQARRGRKLITPEGADGTLEVVCGRMLPGNSGVQALLGVAGRPGLAQVMTAEDGAPPPPDA